MNVSIEGNVGSGKTSLIRCLKDSSIKTVIDPQNNVQYLTLNDFPWCVQKMIHFARPKTEEMILWENNPYILLKVFGHLFTKPLLQSMQYSLFKAIVHRVIWKPTVMFYLDVDVDTIIQRNGFDSCRREILLKVEKQYDYILRHIQAVHVVHLDGTLPAETNAQIILKYLKI